MAETLADGTALVLLVCVVFVLDGSSDVAAAALSWTSALASGMVEIWSVVGARWTMIVE